MPYPVNTNITFKVADGTPTITFETNCATGVYVLEVERRDKNGWDTVLKGTELSKPLPIQGADVGSTRDLNARQLYWHIPVAVYEQDKAVDVRVKITFKQNGQPLAGSVDNTEKVTNADLAYGYVLCSVV